MYIFSKCKEVYAALMLCIMKIIVKFNVMFYVVYVYYVISLPAGGFWRGFPLVFGRMPGNYL